MSTEVETSHPNVIPTPNVILSEAQRSREDLNPNVIPTSNVISTEVQRSGEISAKLDGVEGYHPLCHPESVA